MKAAANSKVTLPEKMKKTMGRMGMDYVAGPVVVGQGVVVLN